MYGRPVERFLINATDHNTFRYGYVISGFSPVAGGTRGLYIQRLVAACRLPNMHILNCLTVFVLDVYFDFIQRKIRIPAD